MKNKYLSIFAVLLCLLTSHVSMAQCNSSTTYLQATTCQGQAYNFNGTNLYTAGTYNDTIVLTGGCDSITSLQLFVIPIVYNDIYDTICQGNSYNFYGQTLTAAGLYGDTLFTGSYFCDSVILLHLAIRQSQNDTIRVSATYCSTAGGGGGGGPRGYNFFGTNYTASGTYVYHGGAVPAGGACADSVVILTLKVGAPPVTIGRNPNAGGGGGGFGGTPDTIRTCNSSYNFYGRILTASGNYSDTVVSSLGCDSIRAYVTLILNSGYNSASVNGTSCNGAPFIWRGNSYPIAGGGGGGFGRPTTYYDTITVSGGCDTIYTITVYQGFAPRPVRRVDSFCAGSTYTYGTYTFTTSGIDTLTIPSNTGGCDSTIYLTLNYKSAPTFTLVDSFCQGSSYTYRGHTYTTSGLHYFVVPAPTGCDSIIQVNLSYLTAPTINITDSFCHGTSYTYRGNTFTTSGLHAITYPAPSGCDTVINLNLSYTTPPSRTIYDTICRGSLFIYGTDTFTARGVYTFTVSTPGSCDSSITLHLTTVRPPNLFVRDSFCLGTVYTFRSNTYTTSGTYNVTLPASVGCDTNATLILTYKVAPQLNVVDSFCQGDSFTFRGHTFTAAGRDTVYLTAAAGCDTVAFLTLNYKAAGSAVISQSGNILIVNPAAATYQWSLNGTPIAGATSQTYVATQSGVYTVSTTSSTLCPATSAGFTVTGVGINEVATSDIFRLYPNPSNGKFTIESSDFAGAEITIYDVLGRAVYQKQLLSSTESVDMSSAVNGTYYLVMKGQQTIRYAHFVIAHQ